MPNQALPVCLDIPTVECDDAGAGHPMVGAENRERLWNLRERLATVGGAVSESFKVRRVVEYAWNKKAVVGRFIN